jgi:hypothetical protein
MYRSISNSRHPNRMVETRDGGRNRIQRSRSRDRDQHSEDWVKGSVWGRGIGNRNNEDNTPFESRYICDHIYMYL